MYAEEGYIENEMNNKESEKNKLKPSVDAILY